LTVGSAVVRGKRCDRGALFGSRMRRCGDGDGEFALQSTGRRGTEVANPVRWLARRSAARADDSTLAAEATELKPPATPSGSLSAARGDAATGLFPWQTSIRMNGYRTVLPFKMTASFSESFCYVLVTASTVGSESSKVLGHHRRHVPTWAARPTGPRGPPFARAARAVRAS